MTKTTIEWAATKNSDGSVSKGEVWNPTTGCTKVSQGCKNCYAERIANRFWGERKFTDVMCHEDRLLDPLKWKKPRRVFVNSMSDLFHKDVPDVFIGKVFSVMALAKHHTFMVLTKRPERMQNLLNELSGEFFETIRLNLARNSIYIDDEKSIMPLPNVWLGVSVEDQATADKRIPILLQTPAAVRFVSVEPMLGPVDLNVSAWGKGYTRPPIAIQARQLIHPISALDWLICGCESGPGARPFSEDWARHLKDQCVEAGVPFFFKQGRHMNGQNIKMPELDGRVWNQYPEEQQP